MADKPWIMRTYSGHSSARESNALYRRNLAKGQTGLSVAFDLPTQTGLDPDHPLARGEVGKVGVPIAHLGAMRDLFDGIPLERMNTSMTINATAPWLLALYVAVARQQGARVAALRGTTQNDLVKEFLSRGTYVFPPAASLRLTADVIAWTLGEVPEWNPVNVCSYHLAEAGAPPAMEVAYALTAAVAILDAVRAGGRVPPERFPEVVGRISFFVSAGIRFVEEMCKMRAFGRLWDRLARERYGVADPALRRFRYGVQVASLGLTEAQPENNIVRIALEALAVTLSKEARARALQLPAWNEALGLPRPWDQQWSLRIQQILAHETDLLEYEDLFAGSPVVEEKVRAIADEAWAELESVALAPDAPGPVEAIESGLLKRRLVEAHAARLARIERGEQPVVGVNRFTESEPSPLLAGGGAAILTVDPAAEGAELERLAAFRAARDAGAAARALRALEDAVARGENVMPASLVAAEAGVTTGEWGQALRNVLGDYRAPTGVAAARAVSIAGGVESRLRDRLRALGERLGRNVKMLVGKPGLDGHSNGAEQIALAARDAGFEVVYEGIRRTPAQLVSAAVQEGVHVVGLSLLSGSHNDLVPAVLAGLRDAGLGRLPVVVGGIIPEPDAAALRAAGVARVYSPKDFALGQILDDLVSLVEQSCG